MTTVFAALQEYGLMTVLAGVVVYILCRGEFFIHGFRNRSLRERLGRFRSSQISRLLKRLRLHGIIKKIGRTYKYYLTELGRHVAVAGLTLKNLFLVPEFAAAALAH
ncbi:MAG TPA: hypothetical protein VGF48_05825 [Thermoanaerobaculia bacterium]|jgi:DNA-binding HxlR family transcriptional regulator